MVTVPKLVRARIEGSSLVISLPREVCAALGLKAGDTIAVRADGEELRARKVDLAESFRRRPRPNGG